MGAVKIEPPDKIVFLLFRVLRGADGLFLPSTWLESKWTVSQGPERVGRLVINAALNSDRSLGLN